MSYTEGNINCDHFHTFTGPLDGGETTHSFEVQIPYYLTKQPHSYADCINPFEACEPQGTFRARVKQPHHFNSSELLSLHSVVPSILYLL